MNVALSATHGFDLDRLVATRLLVQANSGGGKSWCLRRILEQSHGHVQHLVIDPEGEFSTLRERYPYVLAAHRSGDTSNEPRIAGLLAERLLELGASAILDIYELRAHERIAFVRDFLVALVDAPKKLWHPCLVVLDEAHVYCPQQGEAASAGAVIDLCTRGRKRGYAPVLATQRLSKLHKDAAAECNNKLIGRTGLDVDVKRAADELGFGKERWRELRELAPGRFFGFGPALSRDVVAVDVGPVLTRHPSAGERIGAAAPPTPEKVRALLPKLADLPAEAAERHRSIEDLRRENAQLKRELTIAKKATPPAPAPKRVEVPVLGAKDQARLEKAVRLFDLMSDKLLDASQQAHEASQAITAKIHQACSGGASVHGEHPPIKRGIGHVLAAPASAPRANGDARVTPASTGRRGDAERVSPATRLARDLVDKHARAIDRAIAGSPALSSSQQRILNALHWLESIGLAPAEKSQVALLADQSPTSGGYANNLGKLRTLGLIEYPAPGRACLTAAGREASSLAADEIPNTPEQLHDQVCRRLSGSQARILRELIARYPDPIAKADLAERTDQSPTSGGYANNLGRLRTLGLIGYPAPGQAIALPVLFPRGDP